MIPVNFNQLYYFWVVAKSGSISSGAQTLLLNQSTISLQMKQLETAVGRRLLVRGRAGVTLTDAGKLSFEHCERIFGHAEELLSTLKSGNDSSSPVFRIGASQSIPRDKILALTGSIKKRRAGIRVKLHTRSSEELEQRLERRLLDVIVSDLDLSVRLGKECRSRLAWDTPLYFVATPQLKKRMGRFPAGLQRLPLLMRAPENPIRKEVEVFLHRSGLIGNIEAESENPDLLRAMTLEGLGAAVVDPASVAAELRSGRLLKLHKEEIGINEKIWLIARQEGLPSPTGKLVDSLMRPKIIIG